MASEDIGSCHLDDEETIARCAIQPKYLNEGIFSDAALLSPTRVDAKNVKKTRYGISVASKKLLETDASVHLYGCRTAKFQNDKFAERKLRPPTADETSYYRGFYDISVAAVRRLSGSEYEIEIFVAEENGESAHCEIRLNPDVALSKDELSDARLKLIVEMGRLLNGPNRHLCEEDVCVADHLARYPIPDIPPKEPSVIAEQVESVI